MKYHDPVAMRRHVDRARNAVSSCQPHFPELALQVFDVGLLHRLEAVLFDQRGDSQKSLT
jgi:hypothetical protein